MFHDGDELIIGKENTVSKHGQIDKYSIVTEA